MKLIILVYLSCYSPSPCTSQSSFSPFSFIDNLFKSAPSWTSPRKARQRSPTKKSKIIFRPHLPLSPSFSASQEVPQDVKFSNKLPTTVHTSRPSTKTKYPIIRISSHSNFTQPSPTPNIFFKSNPSSVGREIVSTFTKAFKVTENAHHSKPSNIQKDTINKGNKEVVHLVTVNTPSDQIKTTSFVTPQTSFSSYSLSHENEVSGPNPGDFPIISLIDEPAVNYYEQILETIGTTKDSSNPYYAPEEFTYNQDPILIDHSDKNEDDLEEITQSVYDEVETFVSDKKHLNKKDNNFRKSESITTTTTTKPPATTLANIFYESLDSEQHKENSPRSLNFKGWPSQHQLFKTNVKSGDITNLVNTIEYKPEDIKQHNTHKHDSKAIDNLGFLVDCGAGSEKGFCTMGSSYPKETIEALIGNCSDIVEALRAVIPEDFDALGDNSINVISSEKDLTRPWSWKVYAYKKRQICDSELSFTRPSYALDTEGNWRVILQTDRILQRVSLDTCTKPGYPCPGVSGCGRKSSCVQRFSHQLLLSLPSSTYSTSSCPSIRAFKFPSGCVCHAEINSQQDKESDSDLFL